MDDTVYELSKNATLTIDGLITELKKTELIEEYLSVENLKGSKYIEDYNGTMQCLSNNFDYEKTHNEKLRNIDTRDVIPENVYTDNISIINKAIEIISDDKSTFEQKFEQTDILKSYTVSVSKYNYRKVIKNISVNNYSDIAVLGYCNYDSEKGLVIHKKAYDDNLVDFSS